MLKKREKRIRRHKRVRAKIFGTREIPRLYVFRSSKHIYAQIIDDEKSKTLVSTKDQEINSKIKNQKTKPQIKDEKTKEKEKVDRKAKIASAYQVGLLIAEKALGEKIEKVVFDRGGYQYHGRVKALAEGAREGGLKF